MINIQKRIDSLVEEWIDVQYHTFGKVYIKPQAEAALLAGAKLYFFALDTYQLKNIFYDYDEDCVINAMENPVFADSRGKFRKCRLEGEYSVALNDSCDVPLFTMEIRRDDPLPNNHSDYSEWLKSHNSETMASALREYFGESVLADMLDRQ